jgi:hypothetical protein
MKASKPKLRTFSSKVNGVTRGNRQSLIRNHCRDGRSLRLQIEPENRHSSHAVAVWVWKDGWLFRGWRQLGYLPDDDQDTEVAFDLMSKGWEAKATIWKVVGGEEGRYLGLRIDVSLYPREGRDSDVDRPTPIVASPMIPEPAARALKAIGRFAAVWILPPIVAAWSLCRLAGRPGDGKGIILIASVLAFGTWGVLRVLRTESAPIESEGDDAE